MCRTLAIIAAIAFASAPVSGQAGTSTPTGAANAPSQPQKTTCAKPPCPDEEGQAQTQARTAGAPLKGVDVKLGKNPK